MRIASLVPSATEMCFALGLGAEVVAVTHECDHPEGVHGLPRLTRSVIPEGLDEGAIDAAVRERTAHGESLYELDTELLAALEPDLIVTQELCAVCAVSFGEVRDLARRLPGTPRVLSQNPVRLVDVLDDALELAAVAGDAAAGEQLRSELSKRLEAVRLAVEERPRPRVACLEWLDPPYAGGHWVPDMVALAGGEDCLAEPGARSRQLGWEEIADAAPDLVVVMPCGLDAAAAAASARSHIDRLAALGPERIWCVDAAASFSRPGPRLADGVELLAHLLHPEEVPAPGSLAYEEATPRA